MGSNRSGKRRTEKQKRAKRDARRLLLKQAGQATAAPAAKEGKK